MLREKESLDEGHGFSRAIKSCADEGFKPLRYAFRNLQGEVISFRAEFATNNG